MAIRPVLPGIPEGKCGGGDRKLIDNTEKARALIAKILAALPVGAEVTARALETLRENSPELEFPRRCEITTVYYAGDEGGIICTLDFGLHETKKVHIISITHLIFDRKSLLSREIRAYQKHRIKRLQKLNSGLF